MLSFLSFSPTNCAICLISEIILSNRYTFNKCWRVYLYNKMDLPQHFFDWPTWVSLEKGRESRWDEIFTVSFTVINTELESQVNFEICVSRVDSVALTMGLQVCHKDRRKSESLFVSVWWSNFYWTSDVHQNILIASRLQKDSDASSKTQLKDHGLRQGKKITHVCTESQNILSEGGPTRITKTK